MPISLINIIFSFFILKYIKHNVPFSLFLWHLVYELTTTINILHSPGLSDKNRPIIAELLGTRHKIRIIETVDNRILDVMPRTVQQLYI